MGQAKRKQLECPVLGRRIKPVECGEKRQSKYDCPADCEHNPWNPDHYDRVLEIFDRYMGKALSRLRQECIERDGYAPEMPRKNPFQSMAWVWGKFYRERDNEGLSFFDRWQSRRFAGLNNDQNVYVHAESQMEPALLELLQIIDDKRLLVNNLLNPSDPPFVMLDRSMAEQSLRFDVLYCMVYHLPHYSRIHSAGCPQAAVQGKSALDSFMITARHLGAPEGQEAFTEWLLDHFVLVTDAIEAVTKGRWALTLERMDAKHTIRIYDLNCDEQTCRALFDAEYEFECVEPDEQGMGFCAQWNLISEDNPLNTGVLMLGKVLLHEDGYIQTEGTSAERSKNLKKIVKNLFGNKLKFKTEQIVDMGRQLKQEQNLNYNQELVAPELLENLPDLNSAVSKVDLPEDLDPEDAETFMFRKTIDTLLDAAIPALDGRTPREAVSVPDMRPQLIELMKMQVNSVDSHNLKLGSDVDINGVLDALGLDEINFPAPPWRCSADRDDGYDEIDFGDDESVSYEQLFDERSDYLKRYQPAFLRACFQKGFPAVYELLGDHFVGSDLSENDRNMLLDLVARIAFQLIEPSASLQESFDEELMFNVMKEVAEHTANESFEDLSDALFEPAIISIVCMNLENVMDRCKIDADLLSTYLFALLLGLNEACTTMVLDQLGPLPWPGNPEA